MWTSGVAVETLDATWLLLDLGAALRRRRRRRRRKGAAAEVGERRRDQEQEEEMEARIRVFMLEGLENGGGGGGGGQEEPLELVPSIPSLSVGGSTPHPQQPPQPQHQQPSRLLAEFPLRASALWSLPPSTPLSRLPLPPDRACCLLATREGGEGLVVSEGLYEALAKEECGGGGDGRGEVPSWLIGARRVEEEWVAALEDDGPPISDQEEEEEGDEGVRGALEGLDVGGGKDEAMRLRARRALAEEEAVRLRAAIEEAEGRLRGEEALLREERASLAREAEGVEGLMAAWEALDAEGSAVQKAVAAEEEVGLCVCGCLWA